MTVRSRVLLNMFLTVAGTVGTILGLQFFFGDYGIIIFWSGLLAYLLYIMYHVQVGIATRKQQDLVDKLKE
jgi:hypothetical protein